MSVKTTLVITPIMSANNHCDRPSAGSNTLMDRSFLSQRTHSSASYQTGKMSFDSMNESNLSVSPGERALEPLNTDLFATETTLSNQTSLVNSPVPTLAFSGKNISSNSSNSGSIDVQRSEMPEYWPQWQPNMLDTSKSSAVSPAPFYNGIMPVTFNTMANTGISGQEHHEGMTAYPSASMLAALNASEDYQNVVYPHDMSIPNGSEPLYATAWHQSMSDHDANTTNAIHMNASATITPMQTLVSCPAIAHPFDAMQMDRSPFDMVKHEDSVIDWDLDYSDVSLSSGYSLAGFLDSQHSHPSPHIFHPSVRVPGVKRSSRPSPIRTLSTGSLPRRHNRNTSSSLLSPLVSSPGERLFGRRRETGSCPSVHPKNPYSCNGCDRKFARKEHLHRHEQAHNPDAIYHDCPDPMCTKKFRSRADNLREHFKTHLRRTPSSRTKLPRSFEEFYLFIRRAYPQDEAEKEVARLEAWKEDGGHLKSETTGGTGRRRQSGNLLERKF
jgi:hypothetical protein